MTEKISSIARNTSYFTLALVLQKIISLAYFTMYARELGPNDLGQYYFAISVTSIFAIFIDFGLSNILTREIAKHPEKSSDLLGNILTVKLVLAAITFVFLILWTRFWGYGEITRDLIFISAIAMVLDNITSIFYAIARGFHNLKFESIASVIFQLIVLIISVIIINLDLDIRWLMFSLVSASLFNLVYSAIIVYKRFKLRVHFTWDRVLIRQILWLALPFALYGIFQRFYTFFDSILLFKFAGDRAVGLYQIPFKIIVAIQFLPMAFTASLYPAMSAYWQHNRQQLSITFERAITYSLILGLPIMIGTIALADQIVLLFKEGYGEAVLPLQISMIAVPFMFLSFPIGSLLNACDRQKRNTINIAIVAFTSALLNIILIPKFGVMGACITTVVTSALMIVLGLIVVPDIIVMRLHRLGFTFLKIIGSGILMGIVTYIIKAWVPPLVNIIFASIVYCLALYIFKGFTAEDVKSVWASFKKNKT
ncbi:MAG TPA: flippase [bacterium]|jgi:O-antigen/teichoic acid export membrane protein|nr:flippase [bacterium]